jgi:hypothetical protein
MFLWRLQKEISYCLSVITWLSEGSPCGGREGLALGIEFNYCGDNERDRNELLGIIRVASERGVI